MESDRLGIIADDFTGALDAGAQFAHFGLKTGLALAAIPDDEVVVINTGSREIPVGKAQKSCIQAVRNLSGRQLFKKVDSTLRGHIGAEIEAVLAASGLSKAVLCPAIPQQGRVVKDGMLYVHGVPVHESAFKNDPAYPARSSAVIELAGKPASHLTLEQLRASPGELAAVIGSSPFSLVTADGADHQDLVKLAQAIQLGPFLPCGAFGLASAWAQVLTGKTPEKNWMSLGRGQSPVLVVAGSANSSTHAQIAALAGHAESKIFRITVPLSANNQKELEEQILAAWQDYRAVILAPSRQETIREPAWLNFSQTLSRLAARLVQTSLPAGLILVGGETASHLFDLLHVQSIQLLGEASPGIPFGKIQGGPLDQLPVITKAGGFGQVDSLEKILYPDDFYN